jgi:hypothetical protein
VGAAQPQISAFHNPKFFFFTSIRQEPFAMKNIVLNDEMKVPNIPFQANPEGVGLK